MLRVCVIGGGTAGTEAAMEAARDGAQVTVLERSADPAPAWRSWPELIDNPSPTVEEHRPRLPSTITLLQTEAKIVRGGSVFGVDGSKRQFDCVAVATGSGFAPVAIPGHRKQGAWVFSSPEVYAGLGRLRSSVARVVVAGEGTRALQVADRLRGDGRIVQVAVSGWRHGPPGTDVFDVLRRAATERGVFIVAGTVSRAVGEGRVEAVIVGGTVVPCDAFVILPDRVPRPVPTDAEYGVCGGLSVDRAMHSSSSYMVAAGGCAELQRLNARARIFDEEPRLSGRIAGANAAGLGLQVGATVRWEVEAFNLRWSGVEVEPSFDGLRPYASTVSRCWGPESACSITFDRPRGRVSRVELVEPASVGTSEAPLLGSSTETLRSLAYSGSTDISLVSETARLGLQQWSNS